MATLPATLLQSASMPPDAYQDPFTHSLQSSTIGILVKIHGNDKAGLCCSADRPCRPRLATIIALL
jgi:hypothetical protein